MPNSVTKYQKEFSEFVETCIQSDNTLLTISEGLFTKENIETTEIDYFTLEDLPKKLADEKCKG